MNFEYKDDRMNIVISETKLSKLIDKLEDLIYTQGLYGKMSGSWDITAELDEDETTEAFEELEEGEDWRLRFKVTSNCHEEDGGHSDWWYVWVEVDKELNIIKVEGD